MRGHYGVIGGIGARLHKRLDRSVVIVLHVAVQVITWKQGALASNIHHHDKANVSCPLRSSVRSLSLFIWFSRRTVVRVKQGGSWWHRLSQPPNEPL